MCEGPHVGWILNRFLLVGCLVGWLVRFFLPSFVETRATQSEAVGLCTIRLLGFLWVLFSSGKCFSFSVD